MAQNYVVMARKNLLKPSEAPKYYAVARSGRKVTVKEVCKRITERSSYSKGELEGCIGEFLLEIVNVLDEGNIVQMGDLGNFRMSLKTATATATEKVEVYRLAEQLGGDIEAAIRQLAERRRNKK